MFIIDDWVAASSAAASMVPPMISVVKQLKKSEKDPSAQRLIQELINKTKENCENMLAEVEGLTEEMEIIFSKEELELPLTNIYNNLKWLRNPVVKLKLSHKLTRMSNIRKEIVNSSDNLVALIICNGSIENVSESYKESRKIRADLAQRTVSDASFFEQTEYFKSLLNNYIFELSPVTG